MVVKVNASHTKIQVEEERVLQENLDKIEALNQDRFFKSSFNNNIGRELVLYLCNSTYYTLSNPEPVDLSKNTLSKVLRKLQLIDEHVNKPLSRYTFSDLNQFMQAFKEGKVQAKGNRKINPSALKEYIVEFKRFWRVYRQYTLQTTPKTFDALFFEWGLNLKAPKTKKVYEDYPEYNVEQIIDLANNMLNEEYKVRVLLAVNLMGRKCEMTELTSSAITINPDGTVFVRLPEVKKHSSEKTNVELYTFVKKPLLKYLKNNDFKLSDKIFPSNDFAFAKNLRLVSQQRYKIRINPKTLRKIGVDVAEQLGKSREDIERIGGWKANSDVLNHYFARRRKVKNKPEVDNEIERRLHSDVYVEFDKMKTENRQLSTMLEDMKRRLERMEVIELKKSK